MTTTKTGATKTPATLAEQVAVAEAAAARQATEARAARDQLETLQQTLLDNAKANRAAAQREWLTTYSFADDTEAVKAAGRHLADTLASTELGRALTAYATANLRRRERWARAAAYARESGTPRPDGPPTELGYLTATGAPISGENIEQLTAAAIARLAVIAAETAVDDEAERADAELDRAYRSEGAPEPTHLRVANRNQPSANGHESVGMDDVAWVNGVTFVPFDSGAARYFTRKSAAYDAEAVFSVPEEWSQRVTGV